MALIGHAAAFQGHQAVFDFEEFESEFAVCRVFFGIGLRFFRLHRRIVELGPHLACKEKGPPNPYGANGIQFVGIEQDPGFNGFGPAISPKPVGFNTMNDVGFLFRGEGKVLQYIPGHFSALLRVAEGPSGRVLGGAPHVMKIGRDLKDFQIRPFNPAYMPAQLVDTLGVVPIVASGGI